MQTSKKCSESPTLRPLSGSWQQQKYWQTARKILFIQKHQSVEQLQK
jgi:hypothetical protein